MYSMHRRIIQDETVDAITVDKTDRVVASQLLLDARKALRLGHQKRSPRHCAQTTTGIGQQSECLLGGRGNAVLDEERVVVSEIDETCVEQLL